MLNKLVLDIAAYTASLDPIPLHDAGVKLVILKADPLFSHNGNILRNSGMPLAAYHWIDPTVDATTQVNATLKILRDSELPILAIFADFEQYWLKWNEWKLALGGQLAWNLVSRFKGNQLSEHARQVFAELGQSEWRVFGYTSSSFIRDYAPEAADWISTYRWWISDTLDFGSRSLSWEALHASVLPALNSTLSLPLGINQAQCIGRQFSADELHLPGLFADAARSQPVATNLSVFDEKFLEEIQAVPKLIPLPALQSEAVVTAYPSLNIRTGPGLRFPKIYTIKQGTNVQLSQVSKGWAKLQSYGEEWCSSDYLLMQSPVVPDPDEDPPTDVLPGVTYQKSIRFNTRCHILTIDPAGKRFHVTPYKGYLHTVSYTARQLGAPIVVNADGWGVLNRYPNSIAASDGDFYMKSQLEYRPWINISKDNKVSFAWRKPEKLYNAVSGDRYLIDNGKYNNAIKNTVKDPRTVIGLTRDGKIILLVADGRTSESAGLSFWEVSSILLEMDTVTAINLDGGGSSAMWINDRIVNVPIDENVPGKERPVVNHMCIFPA